MDRLLAGRPQRTDGRLIKDNLWKEAGLSRATMNRAVRILAEWNTRVAACEGFTPGEARKNDELTTLRAKLADKTRECTELHHRLDAAATAIAALHHDNTLLVADQRGGSMLVDHPMTLTIPVSDLERARSWYEGKLGLAPVQEVPGEALAYRTGAGQSLLLFFSDEAGAVKHQLAAWRVDDLAAEVTELRRRDVRFEEYDRPDLHTVDGIAVTPVGRAAWFKDSEGNVFTIIQLS